MRWTLKVFCLKSKPKILPWVKPVQTCINGNSDGSNYKLFAQCTQLKRTTLVFFSLLFATTITTTKVVNDVVLG